MNQNEDVSFGAESDDDDNEIIDENTPSTSTTTRDFPNDRPQLCSSSKGGFTCRYYYPAGAPDRRVQEFIRAWIREQHRQHQ